MCTCATPTVNLTLRIYSLFAPLLHPFSKQHANITEDSTDLISNVLTRLYTLIVMVLGYIY